MESAATEPLFGNMRGMTLAAWRADLAWQSDAVLAEQVALMRANFSAAIVATALTSLGQLWFMWEQVSHAACLAWLAFSWLSTALIYTIQKFTARGMSVQSQALWQVACMGLLGSIWGSSIAVSAAYGTDRAMVYALVVVGGVNSAALSICAALLVGSLAYLVGMSSTLLVGVLIYSDPSFAPLALLVLVYFVMMVFLARNSQQAAVRGIGLQFSNVELVDKLRHESVVASIAQEQAEQANRDKSKFLASASHDLRQPLHAMGLFVEALSRSKLSAEQSHILTHLQRASDSSSEMLTTLLDYSRLEAGAVQAKPKAFALQNLLANLEQEFAMQADAKELIYRSRETTLAAFADPSLVDLVLRNLVSNALRYASRGGVLVAARKRGQHVAVQVWDTGVGIAKEDQQVIFKEFHQLGNPERDRQKGLGLGLAIVKRLCITMDAKLHLRSELGRGSMFELVLPLYQGVLIQEHSDAHLPNWAGLRLLVIDDEAAVRDGMQSLLGSWGCDCVSFESASHALAYLADLPDAKLPQVLLCDYRLRNNLTGAQAIDEIRKTWLARGITAKLPAIIITGDTAPERIREAQSTDALLLHKPVSTTALSRALMQATSSK